MELAFKVGDRVVVHGVSNGVSQDRPFNKSTGTVVKVDPDGWFFVNHDGNTGKLNEHGGHGMWQAKNLKPLKEKKCESCGTTENIDGSNIFCEMCDEEARILFNDFVKNEL